MPELPEVETVRRGLAPFMEDARIDHVTLRRANLRFPFGDDFTNILHEQKIQRLSRRAKYLIATLQNDYHLIMHLGMSGSFRVESDQAEIHSGVFYQPRSTAQKHDHVVFQVNSPVHGKADIIYNDPRRFGFMVLVKPDELDTHPLLARIGVEPLGNDLNAAVLAELFADKATTLKAALLDQRLIAGLGNIYVCEALNLSGLSPLRKAGTLATKSGKPTKKAEELTLAIRNVLQKAIEAGGSSLRDHKQTDGTLGYFQHSFQVYDQAGKTCKIQSCTGTIARIVQNGRSTFYCPACQK